MSSTDDEAVKMPNVAASLIRTWVPIAVGALLTWIASWSDVAIGPDTSATVGAFAAMAVAALYYALARIFESTRGHNTTAGTLRNVGRFMLGGVMFKPVYLSDAEWARIRRLDPSAGRDA
jgi:hypothetical protein